MWNPYLKYYRLQTLKLLQKNVESFTSKPNVHGTFWNLHIKIKKLISRKQLNWNFVWFARMHHLRWTQWMTMWDLRIGRRTAGRPKMRWADNFKKTAGMQWSTQARNRATWKALEREAIQVLWTKSVYHRSQCYKNHPTCIA